MYRFRSTKYLLDKKYNELERQEIYFASPETLNDPMEGVKDVFWQGDEIVWRNFIIHYLLCLEHVINIWSVVGEEKGINLDTIPIFNSESEFPTIMYEQRFNKIKEKFFSYNIMNKFPQLLANRKGQIRSNELLTYLNIIHIFAFDSINEVDSSYGYEKRTNIFENYIIKNSDSKQLENMIIGANNFENRNSKYESPVEEMFKESVRVDRQLMLLNYYKNRNEKLRSNQIFIIMNFPKKYLSKVEELMFPKWYTACFMSKCNNSSVWGNYGDNHKGVCLKFKTKKINGCEFLELKGIDGYGNESLAKPMAYELYEVTYQQKLQEIDFFKSLGRISLKKLKKLKEQWYTNDIGEMSSCIKGIDFNNEWTKLYWDKFVKGVTTKTEDWKFENEYRIIINDFFIDHSEMKDRKYKYNFSDLEGIIFGIKTTDSDKAEIMDIIGRKCRETGRSNFDFYQAEYSPETGKIEPIKLDFLKINN